MRWRYEIVFWLGAAMMTLGAALLVLRLVA
jgi:hypothetical protein